MPHINTVLENESNIEDLKNVTSAGAAADQFLKWDGSEWIPSDLPTFAANLGDLNDVTTTGAASLKVLMYNSGSGIWQPQYLYLNDLQDTQVLGANDGDVLTYNNAFGRWEAAAPSGGGGGGSMAWVSKWTGSAPSVNNTWGFGQFLIKTDADDYLVLNISENGIAGVKGPSIVETIGGVMTRFIFAKYTSSNFQVQGDNIDGNYNEDVDYIEITQIWKFE